ncbi:MAG: Asp-tRNA(Asn)/Glu-tRNA(Gln) amidotransferase subunit GatB [Desulfobacteraceae bacterium]|nr:MAG: Asp-tRNA(Asn)/Glu-tRNA(Gln) amidotransferase subunit GatB [Desulfobacteraceae bacterium]
MEFEPVIGLEVHAQLKTRSKIFCGCSTEFGAPPNTHVCPVCLGMPGVLPVLNRSVVEYALRMAIATNCTIARQSRFARKNYFYPDLPKGYQISQYELPIAEQGHVDVAVDGVLQRIRIRRIHMEEDAGKLTHNPNRPVSMVDLNRAGVPLIEIVSEPDIGSPEAAGAYLRHLRAIVRCLDVCDGNLEEGSFRCDANVSIRPRGATALGTRTELKNLNSFRFVEKAIEYEIGRQKELLLEGGKVRQETRLWDQGLGRTVPMRGKEEAHDYRYFPDPDLLPLVIDEGWIERVRTELPELPEARKARFVSQHGLPAYDAGVLTSDRGLSDYFEECLRSFPEPKPISNWMMGPLLGLLNARGLSIEQSPIPAGALAALLDLVESGAISAKSAKSVFEEMAASGKSAEAVVAEKGLAQISDTGALEALVRELLERNPQEVAAYRGGKTKLMGFFVGEAMKATRGQANPKTVNAILKKMLEK